MFGEDYVPQEKYDKVVEENEKLKAWLVGIALVISVGVYVFYRDKIIDNLTNAIN